MTTETDRYRNQRRGTRTSPARWIATLLLAGVSLLATAPPAQAQVAEPTRPVVLTLERMVDLAMSNSYGIRRVNLDIERTRFNLEAQRAGLKSRVDLNLQTPNFQAVSETKWNSVLQRNEIVRENSRRWQMDLSIRQPVILFGYPTNGTLSLNNRIYRYSQAEQGDVDDIRYYNRYFIAYQQGLFQPNSLKNDLEQAELNLERSENSFRRDVIQLINGVSNNYLGLFEDAYRAMVYADYVERVEAAMAAAEALAVGDSDRQIEVDQMRIELANAREQLQQVRSGFRLRAASIKQDFRMAEEDSIVLEPALDLVPVQVDREEAIRYVTELTPRFRDLDITRRMNEIGIEETSGRGSFRMDLNLSYGREQQDPLFENIWADPTNSYTVSVSAYVPIWDWGARKARISAQRIGLEQTQLRIEEAETSVSSDVDNEIRNIEEYESRVFNMEENLTLAQQTSQTSLTRYRQGSITALDLLQSLERESDTANNFLDAYLGWRRALLRLQQMTYFDFELGVPVLERFGIDVPTEGEGLGG